MHIVIIAWLFTIGVMALALSSALAGVAWFVGAGLLPVLLLVWLLARRRRAAHDTEAPQNGHDNGP